MCNQKWRKAPYFFGFTHKTWSPLKNSGCKVSSKAGRGGGKFSSILFTKLTQAIAIRYIYAEFEYNQSTIIITFRERKADTFIHTYTRIIVSLVTYLKHVLGLESELISWFWI